MARGWDPHFTRPFNDWAERFLQVIHLKKVFPFQADKILLKEAKDGCFSVKDVNRALDHSAAVSCPFSVHLEPLDSQ